MTLKRLHDLGVLVRVVVAEDHVNQLAGWHRRPDRVGKADEPLAAVALHAATEHGAVERVEGGEQDNGAVPLVVVSRGAGLERQSRLIAVERLDRPLFVDREQRGVARRQQNRDRRCPRAWSRTSDTTLTFRSPGGAEIAAGSLRYEPLTHDRGWERSV